MPDDSSGSNSREADSSSGASSANSTEGGRIWRGFKALFFGEEQDTNLRKEIEDAIDEYDEEHEGQGDGSNGDDLSSLERQMLRNLLHFGERDADDVAVPRGDIIAIEEKASFADLADLFAEAGHSRIPVYRERLDHIVGFIHIRDAFAILARGEAPPATLEPLIRQPLYVPQSMGALDLLAGMRGKRTHLAIVLNEYSGTDGIVTIEDLVEEIVGEIEDEHDDAPEEMLVPLDDGCWEADGRAEVEDAADRIDPALGAIEEDVDTLGGLAFVLAGHAPDVGEVITHAESGWRLEVLASDGKRITRLKLIPPKTQDEGENEV